ncbi:MAG: efflux RND transporter permease subunit [Chloroflexi bacterium]|nr:efflux RND transporter permease subunit [Chloroflexota bacterium]
MKLTRLAVFHPVIALTITAAVVIFGVAAYFTLGLEQNPQVNVPIVTITAPYPGASAESVEESVTRPIEDAVAGLGGIKTITSNSQTSVASIVVEFQDGTDVDVAAGDLQQRISGIRSTLPPEVEDPSYAKLDFNDVAVLNLAVTGEGTPDPLELYRVADDIVRPNLETGSGVGRVVVVGGQAPEVHVDILPDRLRAYGLTVNDVTSAVQSQFVSTAGGRFTNAGATQQAPVRISTRGPDLTALGNVPVSAAGSSAPVGLTLANVANISVAGEEAQQILRVNGQSAVGLLVYKQSNANIAQTVDELKPLIAQLQSQLPSGYRLETIIDQSTTVRQTVRGVEEELILAAIITGVVLFFFLHSLRSTVIVLIAIPISLLIALIVMKLTGLTLNNISLIGLTTAIGVLVDDSIVVLENIHSHLERDEDPQTAAIEGRSEIGMAAIAITMVDVAVWGPIIVLSGIVGAFLRSFAIVMVAAVLASLVVSFTLTPLIASRWLAAVEGRSFLTRIAQSWEPLYQRMARGYARLLSWSLRHRLAVIGLTGLVFLSNALILPFIGTEFVPETNATTASVVGELPPGTALEASGRAAQRWESIVLDKTYFPDVQTVYTQVGRAEANEDPRLITLTLALTGPKDRVRTSQEIARVVADAGAELIPDLRTRVAASGAGGTGQPLQLNVFASDLDQLAQLAATAQQQLAAQPELADVTSSLAVGPEATVTPQAARLQDLGLTAQAVSNLVRVALEGTVVGQWTEPGGQDRDVRVGLPAEVRSNVDAIGSLPLVERQGIPVTLRQVATVSTDQKPTRITRVNRQRTATLGAQPNGVPLGAATEAATRTLNGLNLPAGARWELAGTAQTQQESFTQLGLGLAASVILMFMVLSILYENWLQPLLIQTALPLATVGAFLGLLVFGQTLSLPTFIGLIALFGLVGKNSILLVDRANHLRQEGMDRIAALEEAGQSRLRPILMTSAVLIFSMLPVALKLGEGGEGRAPLGAVLVGGMLTNTLLSLVYVPVAYTYFDSFGVWLVGLFRRGAGRPGWRGGLQQSVDGRRSADGRASAAPTTAGR